MDFTKESFIKFCRKIVRNGMSCDLSIMGNGLGFGYFEIKPYANESKIKYNIKSISNSDNEISFYCHTRIGEFSIGSATVTEEEFLRYAKEIRLHGNFDEDIQKIYQSIQNEFNKTN